MTQLPGITSEDGSLKILFQSASAIYLNGVKIKNEQELQAIPADYLESVEVNYMAGSDEMASAQGGIIRIKLKKKMKGDIREIYLQRFRKCRNTDIRAKIFQTYSAISIKN